MNQINLGTTPKWFFDPVTLILTLTLTRHDYYEYHTELEAQSPSGDHNYGNSCHRRCFGHHTAHVMLHEVLTADCHEPSEVSGIIGILVSFSFS